MCYMAPYALYYIFTYQYNARYGPWSIKLRVVRGVVRGRQVKVIGKEQPDIQKAPVIESQRPRSLQPTSRKPRKRKQAFGFLILRTENLAPVPGRTE